MADDLPSVTITGTYSGGQLFGRPGGKARGDPHGADRNAQGRKKAPTPPQTAAPTLPDPVEPEPYVAPPPLPPAYVPPPFFAPIEPVRTTVLPIVGTVDIIAGPRAPVVAVVTPSTGYVLGAEPFLGAVPVPRPAPRRRPRRVPKKKPAPRRSPRRTAPPPRLPIIAPALRFGIGRLLGVVSLLPLFGEALRALDDQSQESWNERLYGAPDDDPDTGTEPDGSIGPAGHVADDALPEVVVTATQPSNAPRPRPVGAPLNVGAPTLVPIGIDWFPSPSTLEPFPRPRPRPRPRVNPEPRYDLDVGSPFSPDPFVAEPRSRPKPRPRPDPLPAPTPSVDPFAPTPITTAPGLKPSVPIRGNVIPLPGLGPIPMEAVDRCNCPKPKKRKPSKPRTTCYRGTYFERDRGTTKRRLELVSCATGKPLAPRKKSVRSTQNVFT